MYYFSFLRLTIIVAALLLSPTTSQDENLKAVKCRPQFPSETYAMSPIYDGEGKIYLFGGYASPGTVLPSIHLYNVWDDTLERVGDLPSPTFGNALAKDNQGNLYSFGGFDAEELDYSDAIVRFNTNSNVSQVVGRLPKRMNTIGAMQPNADSALVFGPYDILEVDLQTLEVTQVGEMIPESFGVAWDGGDKALLFGHTEHQLYSISGNNATNFTSPDAEPHFFYLHHSVISTPKSAFIVGNDGREVGRGDGIFQVDFESLEFTFWPVDNYPAAHDEYLWAAAATYVPELHRLYLFGGFNGVDFLQDIWYIDLPGGGATTTPTTAVPITSTTPKPCDHAQCPPFLDGNYPDPQDCSGFVSCVAGRGTCHDCPPGLLYHIENNQCDFPENVDCGSRPIPSNISC